MFLEGDHHLNTLLVLDDITNMAFSGVNMGARIIVSAEAGILCTSSSAVALSFLRIEYSGRIDFLSRSLLLFNNSEPVLITDVQFSRLDVQLAYLRAVSAITYIQSDGHIANSSFSHGSSVNGGAIYVDSSTISFSGVNFLYNTAEISGGAIHANRSTLVFSNTRYNAISNQDYIYLSGNPRDRGGGSIFASQSTLELSGYNIFAENVGALRFVQNSRVTVRDQAVFNSNALTESAISSFNSNLTLFGDVNFANNSGAILASESAVHCQGDIHFMNNTASFAGAILINASDLVFLGNITFSHNFAYSAGGAVIAQQSRVVLLEG